MKPPNTQPSPRHWSAVLLLSSMCFGLPGAFAATPLVKPSVALGKKPPQAAKALLPLAALQRQAQASIDAANAVDEAGRASQAQLQAHQRADLRLQEALQQAHACLAPLQSQLAAMDRAAMNMQQALAQSHTAVQAIAQAGETALAVLAQSADAAFAQRDAAELGLQREHEALQQTMSRCNRLTSSAQLAYGRSDTSARRLADQASRLIERRQTAQSEWQATRAAFEAANKARWLKTPTPVPMPVGDKHVVDLARELARSARWTPNTPLTGDSPNLAPVHEGLLPLWTQWIRLQDAAAYIDTQMTGGDCTTEACAAFTAERSDLAQRIADTQNRLDREASQWQSTPDLMRQSLRGTAAQQAALAGDVRALETALVPATDQTQSEAQAIAAAAQPLIDAAEAAHAKAQKQWLSSGRLAHKRAPNLGESIAPSSQMPMPMPMASAAPAPSTAMNIKSDIRNHAFEMFSEIDHEIKGFGAYTYVLVRSAIDMDSAAVRRRFERLLATLETLPSAGQVDKDLIKKFNVFCVPVLPGSEQAKGPKQVQYASDLGQQLKILAQDGLLTQASVRHRLGQTPGPFLITLPTRLSKARSTTPVLIADLSTYPEEAIADLASHYMNGLVDDFPSQKAMWRPPVLQRVALFMIHMAEGTGELITSAMPTAQAATAQPEQ
jgi:hypothetical protein